MLEIGFTEPLFAAILIIIFFGENLPDIDKVLVRGYPEFKRAGEV